MNDEPSKEFEQLADQFVKRIGLDLTKSEYTVFTLPGGGNVINIYFQDSETNIAFCDIGEVRDYPILSLHALIKRGESEVPFVIADVPLEINVKNPDPRSITVVRGLLGMIEF